MITWHDRRRRRFNGEICPGRRGVFEDTRDVGQLSKLLASPRSNQRQRWSMVTRNVQEKSSLRVTSSPRGQRAAEKIDGRGGKGRDSKWKRFVVGREATAVKDGRQRRHKGGVASRMQMMARADAQ